MMQRRVFSSTVECWAKTAGAGAAGGAKDWYKQCRDCKQYSFFPSPKNSVPFYGRCLRFDDFAVNVRMDTFKCGLDAQYFEERART
jgi:hypothetical protein